MTVLIETAIIERATKEDIEATISALRAELEKRKSDDVKQLCVYTHDCVNAANHHIGKYKHWAKVVQEIDAAQVSAYAFVGPWLQVRAENLVPVGSIVVECCGTDITAYKVTGDNAKEEIGKAERGRLSGLIATVKAQIGA